MSRKSPGLTGRPMPALILGWGVLGEPKNQVSDGRRDGRGTLQEKFHWRPAAPTRKARRDNELRWAFLIPLGTIFWPFYAGAMVQVDPEGAVFGYCVRALRARQSAECTPSPRAPTGLQSSGGLSKLWVCGVLAGSRPRWDERLPRLALASDVASEFCGVGN